MRNRKNWHPRAATAIAILSMFLVSVEVTFASPQVPGQTPKQPLALVGAQIYPVSSPPIARGIVLISDGKIAAVGNRVELPSNCKRIDVSGLRIYPGLIDAYCHLGLIEIDAVRATRDISETGLLNPNVRAEVAVNPDSELIPVTRAAGVLLAHTVPRGSLLAGTSAVIELDGWTWEEMTLKAPAALVIDWPRIPSLYQRLERAFQDAQAYLKARQADPHYKTHPRDARWEAMIPVLQGKVPVLAVAYESDTIRSAVEFAKRYDLKLVLYGGWEAPYCASLLKRFQVPVIVPTTHSLPHSRSEPYDACYSLPARLYKAGIPFCIASRNTWNARNLPLEAGMAVAYGLPQEEALKAVTLYPAQILGIEDKVGSLEVGKDATLIVTDGDILETPTTVKMAFIRGKPVDLSNRHLLLYEKYRQKYEHGGR